MSCARFVSTPLTPAPIPRPHFFLLPFSLVGYSFDSSDYDW